MGRRRVRGEVSGRGRAAGSAAAAAGSRRSAGAGRPAARGDGAVRGEVSRERRALAAAAEAPAGHARAAVAAAEARRRSAGGRVALRIVSGAARNLSRVPARLLRHAGARRDAGRHPQPEDPRRDRRFGDAVAVCRVAALQLRRQLHLRRRRAAGRAARAGARRRSGAAARAARRRGAARAARCRRRWTRSSGSCSGSIRSISAKSADARPRHAAVARRSRREEEIAARAIRRRRRRAASARWSRRGACCRCASPASRATSRSRTRRAIRDALGVPLPPGIPESLLQPVRDPLGDLALRYARTHAPFTAADFAARYGLRACRRRSGAAAADRRRTPARGRVPARAARGASGPTPACCGMLRRRSLAKLRHEIEPVDQAVLGRFATTWQGIVKRRRGADALLDAIEQLQGAPLPASILETRDPAGADRRLRSGRSRCGHRGRRGGLGRRRAARRARRPRRVVSGRSSAAAAAAAPHGPPEGGHYVERRLKPEPDVVQASAGP